MPKCSEVAKELRKLAEALDKGGDLETIKPHIFFSCSSDKERFLNTVSVLPRPLKKTYENTGKSYDDVIVEHDAPALWVRTSAYRSVACRLIEPAKPAVFDCVPLLSEIEEEQLA